MPVCSINAPVWGIEERGEQKREHYIGGLELTNESLVKGKEYKEKGQGKKRFECACQSGRVGLN